MNIAVDPFWKNRATLFDIFKEVYLFGSALSKPCPDDIDLILVYDDKPISTIEDSRVAVNREVFDYFSVDAHLVVLSETEKHQTKFLDLVGYKKIK